MPTASLCYRRVLLKLSGEALLGKGEYGIDPELTDQLAEEIIELWELGVEVALVIGGGNILRGEGLASAAGIDRVTADQMGMLATVINALAMQSALEAKNCSVRVMSAIRINEICEDFIRRRAVHHLRKRHIVIFAAGTGNPFFTTDSAASLRAVEIDADLLVKATKVKGVYSADPVLDSKACYYDHLTYDEVIEQKLDVMDTTAVVLCRDHNIPLIVMDMTQKRALQSIARGQRIGTLVSNTLPEQYAL